MALEMYQSFIDIICRRQCDFFKFSFCNLGDFGSTAADIWPSAAGHASFALKALLLEYFSFVGDFF